MSQVGCRLRNLGLLWVFVLTCSNILLTVRLLGTTPDCGTAPALSKARAAARVAHLQSLQHHQAKRMDGAQRAEAHGGLQTEDAVDQQSPNAEDDLDPDTISVDPALGRWDSRRVLKMFDLALVGAQYSQLSAEYKVTLATQTSLERLHSLVQVVHHWTGPVSVALYAAGDEWPLVQAYVRYLRRCYAPIRERVAFHAAFPADRLPESSPDQLMEILSSEAHLDCFRPEPSLKELMRQRTPESIRWRMRHGYPQNHMRNLARKACQTEYVFLVDVDVVPSMGLAQGLNDFLQTAKCTAPSVAAAGPLAPPLPKTRGAGHRPPPPPQCAYVIPTYELDERVRFPRNKSDLVRLAGKGLARPFHHKVFIYNQYATNFTRWQSEGDADNAAVHVAYNVTNFEFLYEPFYVARDTMPPHDERFMGYGYTRNTQVYEMFVAGVQFQVLSPTFSVHWGLQSKQARPAWRELQNNENRRHFDVFKREVAVRYRRDPLSMVQPARTPGKA